MSHFVLVLHLNSLCLDIEHTSPLLIEEKGIIFGICKCCPVLNYVNWTAGLQLYHMAFWATMSSNGTQPLSYIVKIVHGKRQNYTCGRSYWYYARAIRQVDKSHASPACLKEDNRSLTKHNSTFKVTAATAHPGHSTYDQCWSHKSILLTL